MKSSRPVEEWLLLLLVAGALATWEVAARLGLVSRLFFPAPSTIASALGRQLATGALCQDLGATASRLFLGLVLGGLPGLAMGLAMGWSQRLRAVTDPLVATLHPLPKVALLPLVMVVFGIGETSKVFVVALAAFFPLLVSTMTGVRQINPIYYQVAQNYGAGRARTFARVVVPGSLPLILSGLRISLNTALLITISLEMVAARHGLGAVIWLAWETLRTPDLYAALVIIGVLGAAANWLLRHLAVRLVPWQVERDQPARGRKLGE